MRPGAPIYDGFTDDHIALDVPLSPWRPLYSCSHARDGWVTTALVQFVDGHLNVLSDVAHQGSAEEWIAAIAAEAALLGQTRRMGNPPIPRGYDSLKAPDLAPVPMRRAVEWIAPATHWDRWMNVGLIQAIARLPAVPQQGGEMAAGREWLAEGIGRIARGEAVVQVSQHARWTLRALSGGYCRDARGVEAETGPYRCLMEGLESWLGLMQLGAEDEDDETLANFATDRQGRRYRSVMPARH